MTCIMTSRSTYAVHPAEVDCATAQCGRTLSDSIRDGSRGHLRAPLRLCYVFHVAHGDACQIHLYERFLYAALPTAVPFDDGCLKGHTLQTRHMQRYVSGCRGELMVIVAAAVALPGLVTLVTGRSGQLFRFYLHQLIQGFFYATSDQFFDLPLDYFLVQLYNLFGYSLLFPF